MAHTVRNEIRSQRNQKRIHYKWHEADGTELEGIFARGDRRIAPAIVWAYEHGAVFDAWTDYFNYQIWLDAFKRRARVEGEHAEGPQTVRQEHPELEQETRRRRTFAIISHPDAGKTTLTEKLLLYGGAIQSAGSVKGGTGVCYEKRTAGYDPTKRRPVYENGAAPAQKKEADS